MKRPLAGLAGLAAITAVCAIASPAAADWQPAVPISSPNSSNSAPSIAVDAAGDGAAVWTRKAGPSVQASIRAAGGQWTSPETLSTGPAAGAPRVGAYKGGRAIAVWAEERPGSYPVLAA